MLKRVLRVGAGAVLAAALAVPVVLLPLPSYATDITITMIDFDYQPENRSIKPNDRVRWTNTGQVTHSVTFVSGPDIDQDVGPDDTSAYYTFPSTGTFRYYCRFHGTPEGGGMSGTITVTTGSTASPAPQPTGSGTRTITIGPTATRRPTTRRPTPRQTATPTAATTTLTPTPTTTPTPTPTETFATETPTPIIEPTDEEVGSSGNAQALIAVGVVLALGILGFLIYRRTLAP